VGAPGHALGHAPGHGQEHPLVDTSFNDLGIVYTKMGDLENALVQLQKALEVSPDTSVRI
jgi:Tfp pilus assembly protein PilF